MKYLIRILSLWACAGLPLGAHARLNVVATTADLGALAEAVGGDRVGVLTLAKPTEDPHFVDAKPSSITKLNRADVLLEGGAELELGWLSPLLEGARNPRIAAGLPGRISGAAGLTLLEVPATLDRSKGDLHATGNPHYLNDPVNARIVAQHIADVFSQLDPKSADKYRANFERFAQRLDTKLPEWQQTLAPFRGQHVVSYHNTWPYFAKRFGLNIDLFLEPKPGIPPTPAHLAEVIGKIKADGVRVIILEPYQNRKTADTVAADTGAVVLEFSQYPGGVKGTEGGYLELMDYTVNALAKALSQPRVPTRSAAPQERNSRE